jgi:hypothetical protein
MTIGMSLATLLLLLVFGALVCWPGWLLYRVWLRRLGLSWRIGMGLVLALLSILFGDLSALFGYSLALALGIVALVVVGTFLWWLAAYLHRRAHAEGRLPPKQRVNWTGVLFHLFLLGFYLAPAFVLYLPFDTDAQGFGYLALMVREGGTIDTLAPWQPDVHYLYSPAVFVWWAFLSDLLTLPLHQVMLPSAHLAAVLLALLSIDLGQALAPGRPRMRWLLPLMIVAGLGLFLTLMDSAYTSVMGFLFVTLFLALVFHALRENSLPVALLASIALAAIALTHPDTIIILLLGYVPFYATFWLSRSQHRARSTWLRLFVLIPAVSVALTVPWLARVWPLFFEEHVVSPFVLSLRHVRQLVLFQGVLVPLLALAGAVIAARRRWLADVLMLTWLVFIIDFSLFGLLDKALGPTGLDVMRYAYPFSIAWHGPILVYAYLAALALDHLLEWRPLKLSPPLLNGALGAVLLLMLLAVLLQGPILSASYPVANLSGAFSSRADLAAMAYLRTEAPSDALVLNYPGPHEAHWLPVIAERESVYFREQPFFSGAEPYYERARALSGVYFDLSQPGAREALHSYGVTHVVIPQIVTQPDAFGDMHAMMRWRWPEETLHPLAASPGDIDWLELVFEQDGARVYRVLPSD